MLFRLSLFFFFFFFNDTATTEIYTLSLHDALPISAGSTPATSGCGTPTATSSCATARRTSSSRAARTSRPSRSSSADRKSTRLNSSHGYISYAVFCLKKKKKIQIKKDDYIAESK